MKKKKETKTDVTNKYLWDSLLSNNTCLEGLKYLWDSLLSNNACSLLYVVF